MSTRALLPVLLSTSLACTSTETIAPGARMALAHSTTADFLRVPTEDGGTVEFGPNATLRFGEREVAASDVYMTEWGLYDKSGEPIAPWDGIRYVKVAQPDGLATVAVAATAAIAIVAIAALLKSAPSTGGGGSSKGSSASSGGSAPRSMPTRSAPNPSPIIPAPNPDVTEVAFRTIEMVASANTNAPTIAVQTDEERETSATIPLFSRGARRRANIRAVARLEGGACWPGSGVDCIVSGARIGMRVLDMLELTGGARVESNGLGSQPLAVFGAMLHGESPGAHWFALAAGASVAFDATRAHVVPTLGVRFRPVRGFWIGLMPVQPVYAAETGTWSMASGGEVTGEF